MMLGWDQIKPPDPPYLISVDVTGVNSIMIRIQESCDGPIVTKFKGKDLFVFLISYFYIFDIKSICR